MMVDVSVVIVSWNTRHYLVDCVRSLLAHRGSYVLEIIVVDNASQDDSVASLRRDFPEVTVVENERNLGFARANNQGIGIARGRYVCLVNSDVLLLEDSVGSMLNYMESNEEVGVLGPKLLWKDRTLQGSCRKFPSLWNTLCPAIGLTGLFPRVAFLSGEHMVGFFRHDHVADVDAVVGAFMMVRGSALQDVGGMDEQYFMYCEEVDWCKRFADAGWRVRFFPATQVIHYGGGSSSAEPLRFFREYCVSNLRYWRKHHSPLSVAGYRLVMLLRYLLRLPCWALLCWTRKTEEMRVKLRTAITGLRIFVSPPRRQ
jgi:GT2 family glycosyltransferase